MRVAVASFEYEGNSLSLRVERREDFERRGLLRGEALLAHVQGKNTALAGGIGVLQEAGFDPIPTLAAKGGAGGHIEETFFQETLAEIAERVKDAAPLDGVFLALHGAMICGKEKDPEGAILTRVRKIVGPDVPIAASLDLHAHVTDRMVEMADILVGYETYPHVDAFETGSKAADMLVQTLRGEIDPVVRLCKYNAIVPVLGGATLDGAPMAEVAAKARSMEAEGRALSISYFPVQPWLDMADVGITGVAVTDGDAAGARAAAQEILDEMWQRRHAFELEAMTADQAVPAALGMHAGTVLLIDAPDSIGGGAAGDSPALLTAILKHAPDVSSAISIYDPHAAQRAFDLGVGAVAEFSVGAWLDTRWGPPVKVTATVESLHDGRFVYRGGPVGNTEVSLGPSAVLRVGGLQLLCASHAVYEHMDEHYAACGIDISGCRLVSFKNLMNFRKLLSDDVEYIALHGPGATPLRLQDVAWENRKRPYWPADNMETPEPL
ncbi:M81 family metallopeptidase [Sedimentitalea todarodis]|uniref:Microcystinase C n=1 Tax=Sedimentitalea todarodis TaxID=1631240 RepID=A0ABU3VFR4_9RHOB|nr:M81 family metallopeptidase [Sedimentitalea todarodis]MDU9004544.1 M81 family metallopeptidase [Sedimentitalea todarodis]